MKCWPNLSSNSWDLLVFLDTSFRFPLVFLWLCVFSTVSSMRAKWHTGAEPRYHTHTSGYRIYLVPRSSYFFCYRFCKEDASIRHTSRHCHDPAKPSRGTIWSSCIVSNIFAELGYVPQDISRNPQSGLHPEKGGNLRTIASSHRGRTIKNKSRMRSKCRLNHTSNSQTSTDKETHTKTHELLTKVEMRVLILTHLESTAFTL